VKYSQNVELKQQSHRWRRWDRKWDEGKSVSISGWIEWNALQCSILQSLDLILPNMWFLINLDNGYYTTVVFI
jgi:hypothetical protein